jgi:hypothetical protein
MRRPLACRLALLASIVALPAAAHAQIKPLSVLKTRGGPLAAGTYTCRQQYNQAGYTLKVVELVDSGSYAYRGSQRHPGEMRYDARTGEIRFTTGKLTAPFRAVYGRRDDGHPIFILIDGELEPKADAYDYCARNAAK